jgi:hypothetical protein
MCTKFGALSNYIGGSMSKIWQKFPILVGYLEINCLLARGVVCGIPQCHQNDLIGP